MKPRKAGSVCGPRPPTPKSEAALSERGSSRLSRRSSMELREKNSCGCCVTASDTSCGIPAHREERNNGRRAATGETMTGLVVEDRGRRLTRARLFMRYHSKGRHGAPSPVNNVTLRARSGDAHATLESRTLTIDCPGTIGRDWIAGSSRGPLYQIPIFFISHFSPSRMKVDESMLKLLDISRSFRIPSRCQIIIIDS
ncbi:hypothetical protein ALC53_11538 [Atta colombica]|uniref:Uncharacterized protein n=1 Tax=Atta colombica TaxID=520822 RepID=A0A195B1A6_9HYME|nr:hypothetical protein ALC53_11538 [Atta colombica]